MRKFLFFLVIILILTFSGCVSLLGPGFDAGDGPAKYLVAGDWEVKVLCDALSADVIKINAEVTQDGKVLAVKFNFGGQALSGKGYVNDQEDIWMGGSHSGVAKAEMEGKIIPGNTLTAEGIFWFQKIGDTSKYGTFTAKMLQK